MIALRHLLSVPRAVVRLIAAACAFFGTLCISAVATALPIRAWREWIVVHVVQVGCRALLLSLGVSWRITGTAPSTGALLVANHLSWLDIPLALANWRCTFIAKREVRQWPLIGALGDALGVIWIDRRRPRDLRRVVPLLEEALRRGITVLLFPESTTTNGCAVLPFRSGLIEAAVRARSAVHPIALTATARAGNADALCWYGSETLIGNVLRVARLRGAHFEAHVDVSLDSHADRKSIARAARDTIVWQRSQPALPTARASAGRVVRRAVKFGGVSALALVGAVSLLYVSCPLYLMPLSQPFQGAQWYNPYAGVSAQPGHWLDANFHAHSRVWRGLTNGNQSAADVEARYRTMSYNVVGISDYHVPPREQPRGVFPVYEHGWNVVKAHRLVLGESRVSFLDYPLGLGRNQRQHVLDALRSDASLIAIVHPALRGGHDAESLSQLVGYDLLEVFNHFLPPADREWDAALSAGRPVWLLANDDSHDVDNPDETGVNRTRIFAADSSQAAVLSALRAGHAYGVHRVTSRTPLTLRSVTMRGDTFTVQVAGAAREIRIVGQNGVLRASRRVVPGSDSTATLSLVASARDAYLRAAVTGDDGALLYTNPVIRWDGLSLPRGIPIVDRSKTTVWRLGWWMASLWWLAFWWAGAPLRRTVPVQ